MRSAILSAFLVPVLVFAVACGGDDDDDDVAGDPDASNSGADAASTPVPDAAPIPDAAPSPDASTYDPTGGIDTPGEHGGTDCPDSDITEFTLALDGVTRHLFEGVIVGADGDGAFYVEGTGNQELFGTIPTDGDGVYAVDVPLFCGDQLVKMMWTNDTCPYVIVFSVAVTTCVDPDIRVTLTWDAIGDDWELHLIKPGGRINDHATDCTWDSCISDSPDWGEVGDPSDDPHKDVDNTGAYGPENIWLAGPETGTYTVMVEHWGSGGDPLSDGSVIFNVAGQPITVVDTQDLPPSWVWTAGTIEFPGGSVTPSTERYNCTGNWSGGCNDAIP